MLLLYSCCLGFSAAICEIVLDNRGRKEKKRKGQSFLFFEGLRQEIPNIISSLLDTSETRGSGLLEEKKRKTTLILFCGDERFITLDSQTQIYLTALAPSFGRRVFFLFAARDAYGIWDMAMRKHTCKSNDAVWKEKGGGGVFKMV